MEPEERILRGMKTIRAGVVWMFVILIASTIAPAQIVDWVVRGKLTEVGSYGSAPPWAVDIRLGDPWELRYHVSEAGPDEGPGSSHSFYWAVPGEVRVGPYERTLELSHILVVYDYRETDYIELHGDVWGFFCEVILESSEDILSDGILGSVLPQVGAFDVRAVLHSGSTWQSSHEWWANGVATHVFVEAVPEPPTYLWCAPALLAAVAYRRRRTRV